MHFPIVPSWHEFASSTLDAGHQCTSVWRDYDVDLDLQPGDKEILAQGRVDFYSSSYYMSMTVTTHDDEVDQTAGNLMFGGKNPYLEASDWGWQIDPIGLRMVLNQITDRYDGIPLMVVENGPGAYDEVVMEDGVERIHDPYRIDYLRKHIVQMDEAIQDGCNLIGYAWWGAIDLVSASTGEMRQRYGFIYVDKHDDGMGDLHRACKDSVYYFQKVCASNGADID